MNCVPELSTELCWFYRFWDLYFILWCYSYDCCSHEQAVHSENTLPCGVKGAIDYTILFYEPSPSVLYDYSLAMDFYRESKSYKRSKQVSQIIRPILYIRYYQRWMPAGSGAHILRAPTNWVQYMRIWWMVAKVRFSFF